MRWDSIKNSFLYVLDTIQTPLELIPDSYFIRNGRNIIDGKRVFLRDLDIHTVKRMIGGDRLAVNNMIIANGKIWLKDTVDVSTIQEFNEIFWKDKNHVYYHFEILDQFDATTFRQVKDDVYEDKSGRYKYSYRFYEPNKGRSFKRIN